MKMCQQSGELKHHEMYGVIKLERQTKTENYIYFKNKRNTEYWRCADYRRLGCSASAKARVGLTQTNYPKHNHTSSIAKVNYLKIEKNAD